MEYVVKRNKKSKNIRIKIKGDGTIVVTAPPRVSKRDIELAMLESEDWIQDSLAKINVDQNDKHTFTDGELFLFAGKKYPLKIIEDPKRIRQSLKTDNQTFIATIPLKQSESTRIEVLRKKFIKLYKTRGLEMITPLIEKHTQRLHVTYKNITINSATSRWGSCSTSGNINFSWRLFLAPPEIIEYVAIHEVCHLVHHNHSKEYWQLVESIEPNYKSHRKWLKTNGHTLNLR